MAHLYLNKNTKTIIASVFKKSAVPGGVRRLHKYHIWSGDNTEKIWVHQFLEKPKTIEAGCLGQAVSPTWGPGQCLGECVGANLLNSFAFFSLIKHTKIVIVWVNIG